MEWISIKDVLPQDEQFVLIYPTTYESDWANHNQTGLIVWAYYARFANDNKPKFYAYDYHDDCYYIIKRKPTHWMPLPEFKQ